MHRYTLSHLSDGNLRQSSLTAHFVERSNTALAVAHLGEVESRGLHLAWGFGSVSAYAREELRLSADAAYNRIRVAKNAREYPALFEELAAGTLHLASILVLAPHLEPDNADDLIRAASGKSRSEIESLLLARKSGPAEPVLFDSGDTLVPGRVDAETTGSTPVSTPQPTPAAPPPMPTRTSSIGILPATREKLGRLKDLLSHQVPSGDLAQVLDRVCDIALHQIERRKYAATTRPRAGRGSRNPRYIPAEVRRAVRARDGNRCAFVSDDGHRCSCRSRLEFDHIIPVALGGTSTVENVRLLCRAHNQFVAERIFGAGFMAERRRVGRERAVGGAQTVNTGTAEIAGPATVATATAMVEESGPAGRSDSVAPQPLEDLRDVQEAARRAVEERTRLLLSGLRDLGYRAKEAREAAEYGVGVAELSLADQMKRALSWFRPRTTRPGE